MDFQLRSMSDHEQASYLTLRGVFNNVFEPWSKPSDMLEHVLIHSLNVAYDR